MAQAVSICRSVTFLANNTGIKYGWTCELECTRINQPSLHYGLHCYRSTLNVTANFSPRQVSLSLSRPFRRVWGVKVYLHTSLASALDGCCLVHAPADLSPARNLCTHWIWQRMGPRGVLDILEKVNISYHRTVRHPRCVFINYNWINQLSNTTIWWLDKKKQVTSNWSLFIQLAWSNKHVLN